MVLRTFDALDYWRWAPELDILSNDHYLLSDDPEAELDIALSGDLMRSLAGGPWFLMEHSTGAVNWQPVNRAKRPGEMRRNALAHVAHGADGIAFFQWRAAKAGAEQWHSAMLPHAGTDSQIWRDVVQLGADLKALAEVRGSTVTAQVAIVWDWDARWALELPSQPSGELRYQDLVRDWYTPLWRAGVAVDFVRPDDPGLDRYRLVLAPVAVPGRRRRPRRTSPGSPKAGARWPSASTAAWSTRTAMCAWAVTPARSAMSSGWSPTSSSPCCRARRPG